MINLSKQLDLQVGYFRNWLTDLKVSVESSEMTELAAHVLLLVLLLLTSFHNQLNKRIMEKD